MYIHFKRIFQVENVPERFKHHEWAQTHHRVMGAGATENTITEGKLKKKKRDKALAIWCRWNWGYYSRVNYLVWRENGHFVMYQCKWLTFENWSKVVQSYPILCNPMDCSLPGSSVHGIFQARILEWAAISFSRGIFPTQGSNPGLPHCRQTLYHLSHQGSQYRIFLILTFW